MKILSFKLLGLTSSLLATAGLLNAAQRLDPLTHSSMKQSTLSGSVEPPGEDCTSHCWYFEGAVKDVGPAQR